MGGADAEREGLAAEYVLGTLTAYEAGLIVRAMATDAQLAEAVVAWERWLAPLADLVAPEAPPPSAMNSTAQKATTGSTRTGAVNSPTKAVNTTSDITRGLSSAT